MAGIPYCHDRADEPPDKEEYEKAMGEPTHRQKVSECQEVAAKVCTEWECEFLESMTKWTGVYTLKQQEVIDRIYKKVCESAY